MSYFDPSFRTKKKVMQDQNFCHIFSTNPRSRIVSIERTKSDNSIGALYISGNFLIKQKANEKGFFKASCQQRFPSRTGGGIGCIFYCTCTRTLFVAESSDPVRPLSRPTIFVYNVTDSSNENSSFDLRQRLIGGAELEYSCININKNQDKLCSVAASPDYTLAIWDWRKGIILLRAKAFGQDIYNAQFSYFDDTRVYTCGNGHIKFWTMANSFTGPKLQGDIGKFGRFNLSDIYELVELPKSGRILSGSEDGHLLLWEDCYVKCCVVETGKSTAHEGGANLLRSMFHEDIILTAGNDSTIRWWPLKDLDVIKIKSNDDLIFSVQPIKEWNIGNNTLICQLSFLGGGAVMVGDARGSIMKINIETNEMEGIVIAGHDKCGIHALSISKEPSTLVLTAGGNKVICWDFLSKRHVAFRTFLHACTCLNRYKQKDTWLAGFGDGSLRIIHFSSVTNEIIILFQIRPHEKHLKLIEISGCENFIASCTGDNSIFLFRTIDGKSFEEIGCLRSMYNIQSIQWSQDSSSLIYIDQAGHLNIVPIGDTKNLVKSEATNYEINLTQQTMNFEYQMEDVRIQEARYIDREKVLVRTRSMDFELLILSLKDRSVQAFPCISDNSIIQRCGQMTSFKIAGGHIILTCFGRIILISLQNSQEVREVVNHRAHNQTTCFDMSNHFDIILSASTDGSLTTLSISDKRVNGTRQIDVADDEWKCCPENEIDFETKDFEAFNSVEAKLEYMKGEKEESLPTLCQSRQNKVNARIEKLKIENRAKAEENIQKLQQKFQNLVRRNEEIRMEYRLKDEETIIDVEARKEFTDCVNLEIEKRKERLEKIINMKKGILNLLKTKYNLQKNASTSCVSTIDDYVSVRTFPIEDYPRTSEETSQELIGSVCLEKSILSCDRERFNVISNDQEIDQIETLCSTYHKRCALRRQRKKNIQVKEAQKINENKKRNLSRGGKKELPFSLKCSDNYIPTYSDFCQSDKKSNIHKLECEVIDLKLSFNEKIYDLDKRKVLLFKNFQLVARRIKVLNQIIGDDDDQLNNILKNFFDCKDHEPLRHNCGSERIEFSRDFSARNVLLAKQEREKHFEILSKQTNNFNDSVQKLILERSHLCAKLSSAKLKITLIAHDISFLKTHCSEYNEFITNKSYVDQDSDAVRDEMKQCFMNLQHAKSEIESWIGKEKKLAELFLEHVPKSHKNYKKIQEYFEADLDGCEEIGTTIKINCDNLELLKYVKDLKKERAEQKCILASLRQRVVSLKLVRESLLKREKDICERNNEVSKKIKVAQKEIFRKLNNHFFPSFANIKNPNAFGTSFDTKHVLFSCEVYSFSSHKIFELKKEISESEDIQQKLCEEKEGYLNRINLKKGTLRREEMRYDEMQLLKFGRRIDIFALDSYLEKNCTQQSEDVDDHNQITVSANLKELRDLEIRLHSLKNQLHINTKENTMLLEQNANFYERIGHLKSKRDGLTAYQQNKNDKKDRLNTMSEEICTLKLLVENQKMFIMHLKIGIQKLNKKHGHLEAATYKRLLSGINIENANDIKDELAKKSV